MMAAVKTQIQTRFRGRTPSTWNRRMAENRAVAGFLRPSVSRTGGIQDNRKMEINTQRLIQFNGVTAA